MQAVADEWIKLYITCKTELPMDVDFMLTDTLDVSFFLSLRNIHVLSPR